MNLWKLTAPLFSAVRGYPRLYGGFKRKKKVAGRLLARMGFDRSIIEERSEFGQVRHILANPESWGLLKQQRGGPRVLCFSLRGAWTTHVAWETLIALGLRLRGAQVEFFTCGGALPACQVGRWGRPPCGSCYDYLTDFVQPFGFPIRVALRMVSSQKSQKVFQAIGTTSWQDVLNYEYKGLNLGQIVLPVVRWYLRRGTIPENEQTLAVYQAFLKSAVSVTDFCQRVLERNAYDVIYCLNGEFFPEAILHILARKRGIRVVTYERGYRPDTLFFQQDGPACKYVVERYWEKVRETPLTPEENRRLDEYFAQRHQGVKGIGGLEFWPKIEEDEAAIRGVLSLDKDRPLATLFTNTTFDTMTQRMEVAFRDMFHWIETTIDYFNTNPAWQLVIRVHPSEIRDVGRESQEPVAEWIKTTFPKLPYNIKVVPPDSALSSYTLMRLGRVGLIYTSLTGMEMALMGKPVIMVGKAHYRNKGFTYDTSSPEQYLTLLESCLLEPKELKPLQLELARRYAHLFFFRAMIPFDLLSEPTRGEVVLNFETLSDLLPGRNKGLDVICSGILSGEDFLL